MPTELKVPELGENVKAGDVLRVLVKVGDTLATDQPVVELETDKATVEIPSTVSGKVTSIAVKPGDNVKVGQVLLSVEGAAEAPAASPKESPGKGQPATEPAQPPEPKNPEPKKAASAQQAVAEQETPPGSPATSPASGPTSGPTSGPASGTEGREGPGSEAATTGGTATFTIPELGENVQGGDVLRVLVNAGDTVAVDQPVIELETDKATVEVPSSVAGKVTAVNVKVGDKVTTGQAVFTVETGADATTPGASPAEAAKEAAAEPSAAGAQVVQGFSAARGTSEGTRTRSGPAEVVDISRGARTAAAAVVEPAAREARPPAPAAPSVRRLARELGLDIHEVPGSGPGERISADDVMMFAKRVITSRPAGGAEAAPAAVPSPALPDFTKWGPIDRQPMRGIRRKTAEHLSLAWSLVPHVTQVEKADVTELEAARTKLAKGVEASGGKLTVTAIALKVVAHALKKFPQVNASIDMMAGEIIYKQYVHVGVAVDTDRGLLVPVIRDVDKKTITQLSAELSQAAEKAREGKLALDEMQGGCFTITNLGGIGGAHFTPIVNYPEVAILGMSRSRMEPVWQDGQFVPRLLLPLSLSYDHRLVDGADAMRFLRYIVDALEQPLLMALG